MIATVAATASLCLCLQCACCTPKVADNQYLMHSWLNNELLVGKQAAVELLRQTVLLCSKRDTLKREHYWLVGCDVWWSVL